MTTKILALTDALGNLVRFVLLPGHRFDTVGVAPLIHGLAFLKYGTVGTVWNGPGSSSYPVDYGYGLAGVYAVWLVVILLLYPVCRWFAELKQRRRDAWLSYF